MSGEESPASGLMAQDVADMALGSMESELEREKELQEAAEFAGKLLEEKEAAEAQVARMAEELAEAKAAAAAAVVAPAEGSAADAIVEPEPAPEAAEEEAGEQAEEGAEPEPEPESVSALFAGSKLSSGGDLFATEPEPESGGGSDQDDLFAEGDGEGDGDLFGGGGGEDDLFAEGEGDELDEGNLFAPSPTAEEGIPPGLQSGIELMEACTKDDTEHAPQEYLEQLATAAMDLDADEARPVAMWLAQRMGLDTDAIPPKLKSLQLVTLFLDVGSDELVADLGVHTIPAVKALLSFSAVDPTYGDRPSAMIRSTAAKVVAKATGGEAAADGAAGGAGPSDDGRGDGLLYGRASTTEDALFAQAMQRRKEKQAAEAVPATSKFTFKSGLKNLVNDLYDSSYLATKSWRVIMPSTTGGEASLGGDDDGGDTTVVSFLSVRHSGDDLTILLDGKEVRVWQQDEQLKRLWKMAPKQIEADYPFTMPGGLGGSVGIVRVATNVYEYQLDVPGEVLDLSEHWLTATVELGAIYIRKATVENEDTADAYICYEVQTLLRGQSRASGDEGYLTLKRFSEFDTLHKLVKSSFSAKLNTSKKITMPKKPSKSLLKRFDEAFVEKRRRELELYLQELIRIPAIGSNPDVLRFLNVPVNAASGGGGGGGGAGGGSGASSAAGAPSSGDLASATEMVERVTTDDVRNAPQDTMAELARMAMATEPKMARHLAACLAQRMQIDATPVKLKSLTLLQMLMGKGSSTFQAAAVEACLEAVQDSQSYTKIDPQFGAKPAQLVQDTARKLVPRLRSAAASSAAGKTKHAQGQVVAKESTKRVDHAQGLSGEVLGWLLECTADDTEPQPPSAVEALTRLVADELNWVGGGGGRGGAAQELAEWLAGRLQGTPQAPVKLKTILLTQKLVPPAVPAVRRQLKAVCREPLMQAMHYNRADEQHGDKPARLVRAKAGELLGLLDRDGAAVRGAAAVAMARSPQQMAATAKMMSGGDDDDDDDGDDCL